VGMGHVVKFEFLARCIGGKSKAVLIGHESKAVKSTIQGDLRRVQMIFFRSSSSALPRQKTGKVEHRAMVQYAGLNLGG